MIVKILFILQPRLPAGASLNVGLSGDLWIGTIGVNAARRIQGQLGNGHQTRVNAVGKLLLADSCIAAGETFALSSHQSIDALLPAVLLELHRVFGAHRVDLHC